MRIGLISDTHVPEAVPELPPEVERALAGVDLILHAGDMHVIDVLDWLERIAPVLSVRGNGDFYASYNPNRPGVPDDPRVLVNPVLHYEGFRLGMTHAFPTPAEVSWDNLDELVGRFFEEPVDIVVTGDSHMECVIEEQGLFLVNPGSPTLPWQMKRLGTVALLELEQGSPPSARIIDLKTV